MTTRAYMGIVQRTARLLDVPLPAEIANLIEQGNTLVAAAESITYAQESLTGAVLDALAAGHDYHEAPAVQRLFLDNTLVSINIANRARVRADAEIGNAIVEAADTILEDWAGALEPHSAALAAAAEQLPTHNLDETQVIAKGGAEAIAHWAAAIDALKKWQAAIEGFQMLAMAAGMSVSDQLLVMAEANNGALLRARNEAAREGSRVDAWTLARHGIPLTLATLGDYMERLGEQQQQFRAAEQSVEDQRREQIRIRYGIG